MVETTSMIACVAVTAFLRAQTRVESFISKRSEHVPLVTDSLTYGTSSFAAPVQTEGTLSLPQAVAISRLDFLKSEIESYSELEEDWDLEGGRPPARSHIDAAKRLLDVIPGGFPLPKTVVTSDGEVGLYWDTERFFADIAVEGDNSFSLFAKSADGKKKVWREVLIINEGASEEIARALQEF